MALLSETDRKRLLKNTHVLKVTSERVIYTPEFKLFAVKENLKGRSASEIFREAEIETVIFGPEYARYTLKRWRKTYEARGELGLKESLQGKKSSGRPKKKYDPTDVNSLKERIAYLEAENDFLKKLKALEAEYLKRHGLN